jgi:hypothetical protein
LALIILDGMFIFYSLFSLLTHRYRLFVVRKLPRAVLFYLMKDFFCSYTAASPHGSWLGSEHIKPAVDFTGVSIWYRIWFVWVLVFITYASLEGMVSLYNVIGVILGLANPRDCPSLFGDMQGMVSVRKAWS